MNERLRELVEQCHETGPIGRDGWPEYSRLNEEKFAELIVRECILTVQLKIVRNGHTPENIRSRQHVEDIAKKFGIELPMDYFGVKE